MKKTLLLLILCISITVTGCRKKEEAGSVDVGGGNVQALQDTGQIEAQYKDVLAKDPRNYEATVGLGNHYFDAGLPEKAIEMYQKALEINPNDANVRTDMGTMYRTTGNFDKAIEAFRKSASIDPMHEQARYNLGVTLYQDKKDLKGAADAWEELLKINPNHPNAEGLRQEISRARNQQTPESKSPSRGWVK
ncbi:MAG: tetratricopeptide repeat protein [Deltaproteobacteria bacterium]|nr:tetratricopeptide repeat protein [Deltaproteobacteria bacterium]